MMKPLKFRYYDKSKMTFVYSDDFKKEDGTHNLQLSAFFEAAGSVDDFYIDQFTGILDKDGKEIYENDIIQYEHAESYDYPSVIKWAKAYSGYQWCEFRLKDNMIDDEPNGFYGGVNAGYKIVIGTFTRGRG